MIKSRMERAEVVRSKAHFIARRRFKQVKGRLSKESEQRWWKGIEYTTAEARKMTFSDQSLAIVPLATTL